jgi:hypothetical protein
MQVKIYSAMTFIKKDSDKLRIINWYCPERLKPLIDCQAYISDYHLCPDEPVVLNDFEYRVHYDLACAIRSRLYRRH